MKLIHFSTLFLIVDLLGGCGQSGDKPPQVGKEPVKIFANTTLLQGVISDNKGPVKNGKVEARTLHGEILAETVLENSAKYQLQIPAGTPLPVVLSFIYVTPSQALEPMVSVVVQPGINKYDINPLTTHIAKQAKGLGGYTVRNMTRAAEDAVRVPDANKTSTGFRGDPTSQYGGWH